MVAIISVSADLTWQFLLFERIFPKHFNIGICKNFKTASKLRAKP